MLARRLLQASNDPLQLFILQMHKIYLCSQSREKLRGITKQAGGYGADERRTVFTWHSYFVREISTIALLHCN